MRYFCNRYPAHVKTSKNLLTFSLMSTSMILLVSLQAVWLRTSYEKASDNLRDRTTRWLREAVYAVRDSTILHSIEPVPFDTIRGLTFSRRTDTTIMFVTDKPMPRRTEGQVQFFVSSPSSPDSARKMLGSIASQLSEAQMRSSSRFTIRLRTDSLNMDSIRQSFERQLNRYGLSLTPTLTKRSSTPPFPPESHAPVRMRRMMEPETQQDDEPDHGLFASDLRTHWVRVDPFFRYAATLHSVRPMLFREITPQILFSGFLTVITFVSFVVMFRSIRSQQRLMALKNDFISNITHELKTPIATVSVALEALKNFKGIENPQLTTEYLDIARLELNRLSMLTEKVLTTSLFDEKGLVLDFAPVDLGESLATILNSMKLVIEKLEASVTTDYAGDDFIIEGSAVHLTNVIHNLLDNALKYSPGKPEITIALKAIGDKVELLVTDKGMGIPAEFQSRIFERFFRMPTGDVHNIKGFGLGLSYVDQVVKKHGGSITVVSAPGLGSTFTVILPKTRA